MDLVRTEEAHRETLRRWAGFGIGFGLVLAYLLIRNEQQKPYDAWTYTELSQCFAQNGLFNFSAFAAQNADSMRGYLFPWILAACQGLSGLISWLDYRLILSAFVSLTCAVALPDLFGMLQGLRGVSVWRRAAVPALVLLFWNGLLAYPLTDMWSAGFAILAAYGLVSTFRQTDAPGGKRVCRMALAGFAMGAAYNIRTVYLFLLPGFAVLYAGLCVARRECVARHWLGWAGCLLAGFLAVSLPQMAINLQAYGSPSFLLISQSGSSLYINKLYDGIYLDKYESYTGVDYGYEALYFIDPAGQEILEQEGLDESFQFGTGEAELGSVGAYLGLVLRHPLDFLGIYGRHSSSLLDVRYPNIYVDTLEGDAWTPLANYTLLYLCLLAAVDAWRRRPQGKRLLPTVLGALLLPVLAAIPGTIEPRYGVLLYLVVWGGGLSLWEPRRLKGRLIACAAVGYIAFIMLLCACNGAVEASLLEYPLLYA